ncbi:MAG TPA: alternative ribosome rescue aminoacyl-tRNA hydrolase ArfB [Chitinophagaceae bacterium]|nr:alternative ribosome rescue aminoacyl-tRNA hydrolase ArfB [Chitinophagaceae bacterium]
MLELSSEISYQTTRSGGKGGQHVNKVETAVIGSFLVSASQRLTPTQKQLVLQRLANRINAEGYLMVKAQSHRSQAMNRDEVTRRINDLVSEAVIPKKPRIATRPSGASRERRLESKKRIAERKTGRRKWRPDTI